MDKIDLKERTRLLDELHEGRSSRNRDFDRYGKGVGQLVHRAYLKLVGLLEEISSPLAAVTVQPARMRDCYSVSVRLDRLNYNRTVRLERWELDYLGDRMGGSRFLSRGDRL